jgi:GDPmannose 4,6-dehydratase
MDLVSLITIIKNCKPTEIYNLAAQSHVKVSDDIERYTLDTNAGGVLNMLQAIRIVNPSIRMVQASTSEMFGNTIGSDIQRLSENSSMKPVSIYGISKLAGYNLVRYYREAHGMFLCNSIAFNHESPRRGKTFVTRKIAEYVKGYTPGSAPLRLGNLDARRDWSHTLDIVEGMWLMLQQKTPCDYTLGSGKSYSVRDFVECAFKCKSIDIEWGGSGVDEYGINKKTGEIVARVDSKYFRSVDINNLVCDNTFAKKQLGWEPKITFNSLVREMCE